MPAQFFASSAGFEPIRPRALSHASREITPEAFERLLEWLHRDRNEAGRIYEQIRRRLIKVFTSRCCDCPEELADETIDRVVRKVEQVTRGYQGDPVLYFYGVARNVFREYHRIKRLAQLPTPLEQSDSPRPELDCLDDCMGHLPPKNRELLVDYYQEDRQAKIDHRKEIARRNGLDMNALRIRVYRIRSFLGECTVACLQRQKIQ